MRILRKDSAVLIRQDTPGIWDENGKYIPGTDGTPETIPCAIQPDFGGRDQVDLPEGVRERDARIIYTETLLQGASEQDGVDADVLQVDGKDFEVFNIRRWFGPARIRAYKVVVIRRDKL